MKQYILFQFLWNKIAEPCGTGEKNKDCVETDNQPQGTQM